jgi:hypothetical protein
LAPLKSAQRKSASLKSALIKSAPRKLAPLKLAPLKSASLKSALIKSTPLKLAPRKSASRKSALIKSAPRKLVLNNVSGSTVFKTVPVSLFLISIINLVSLSALAGNLSGNLAIVSAGLTSGPPEGGFGLN